VNITLIHSTHGRRGLLMQFCDRLRKFCVKYGSDANPDALAEAAAQAYFSDTPGMLCFAIVEDGKIVAHAIVTLEGYYGKVSVNIPQFWKDPGTKIDNEIYREFFRFVSGWARYNGADVIRMTARSGAVATVLAKHGFTETGRVLMSRPLDKEEVWERVGETR